MKNLLNQRNVTDQYVILISSNKTMTKESLKEIFSMRSLAQEYFNIGMNILNAKYSLEEEYYELIQTPLLTTKNLPNFILYDIFEMQEIHSLSFMNKVSRVLEEEDIETYRKTMKAEISPSDLICYFKSLILETGYWTFGFERKCKNIIILHNLLSEIHKSNFKIILF